MNYKNNYLGGNYVWLIWRLLVGQYSFSIDSIGYLVYRFISLRHYPG